MEDFLTLNAEKIFDKYTHDGGWECWLQSEFLDYLRRSPIGVKRHCGREEHIWNAPKRGDKVDIITFYMKNKENFVEALELKCASIRQDYDPGDLAARMQKDIRKLEAGMHYLKKSITADQKVVYCISMGITADKKTALATRAALAAYPGLNKISRYEVDVEDPENDDRIINIWSSVIYRTLV
ncbi:hypothetical protein TWF481_011625 [Arthrobotrys musiformis]|uniref:Uncharacterized protein n=1 Tax=Arthrobotrys musiformis TaxID=47236 RepID=A0AAV9W1T6_9PEZI